MIDSLQSIFSYEPVMNILQNAITPHLPLIVIYVPPSLGPQVGLKGLPGLSWGSAKY